MTNWQESCVYSTDHLGTVVKVLNDAGLRIALVVEKNGKLIGTVTDGDIRRALLRHEDMESPVTSIMNDEPITVTQDLPRDTLLAIMRARELIHMPIVDVNGTLIGLEVLPDLMAPVTGENPVLLMAGGFGKRMLPLTELLPKPLLKIAGKPLLEEIIEQFVEAGYQSLFISVHYKAEMLIDYIGDGQKWGISIDYLKEERALGTAGALGLLPKDLPNLRVIVMNADVVTNVDFSQLIAFHKEVVGDVTMCVRQYDMEVPYGVVEANQHRVEKITEKPTHRFFVNAGIYVLEPDVISSIEIERPLDMPDLIRQLIDNGKQVSQFPIHEYWLDIGMMHHFKQAQIDLAENNLV